MMRKTTVKRKTNETDITLTLNLDGHGNGDISTQIPFFDHMLDQMTFHSSIDLDLSARGDIDIDFHHTVEDCGLAIGEAFKVTLGDKKGINRYGFFLLPMDDSLVRVVLDFSGRSFLNWNINFPTNKVGEFDLELVREFFNAFCNSGKVTAHFELLDGFNSHHICEATFKGVGRAIKTAVEYTNISDQIPSTKGNL